MLKKTGIIVAVAAAGVVALTPFAFATGDSHHDAPSNVQYSNEETNNLGNDCQSAQDGAEVDTLATGGESLVGAGGLVGNVVAPVTAPVNALNCTNVGITDVIDSGSNNTEQTMTETEIEGSNNFEG